MKKLFPLLLSLLICRGLTAQKCLDMQTVSIMEKMETPKDAADSYKKCITKKNDHDQLVIVSYGDDITRLDTLEAKTLQDFSVASLAGSGLPSSQMPAQQQADAARALAEKLKNMTPEQQQEWVKQNYMQNNTNAARSMQDDPVATKEIMQARDIASTQMHGVNNEFSGKLTAIEQNCANEIKGVPTSDPSKCPTDKVGQYSCACVNQLEGQRWKQILIIQDKYDAQKISAYQTAYARLKQMAGEVDQVVAKYKNGDALHSSQLKGLLFSAQSSAFANSVLVTTYCLESVRKAGASAYLNKLNCDNGVYDISCFR